MAVTQNFLNPATGAASPTAAQVLNQNECTVDVTTDGVATTFTVTHNMNISAADLALGRPNVQLTPTAAPSTLGIFTSSRTANTVVLTFTAIASTIRCNIQRPHTVVQ